MTCTRYSSLDSLTTSPVGVGTSISGLLGRSPGVSVHDEDIKMKVRLAGVS